MKLDPLEKLDRTDCFELSDQQLSVVNERYSAYQRGEAKTYSWAEVQRMLEDERHLDKR